jgi:hypothetical protein
MKLSIFQAANQQNKKLPAKKFVLKGLSYNKKGPLKALYNHGV